MNREQAIQLYLSRQKRASKAIAILQTWDPSLTLVENQKAISKIVVTANAKSYVVRYGLKYQRKKRENAVNLDTVMKMKALGMRAKSIAKAFGVSRQYIYVLQSEAKKNGKKG